MGVEAQQHGKGRCYLVNTTAVGGINGTTLINGLTNDVHDTAKHTRTNRDGNGGASIGDLLSTDKTLSTVHSDGTDSVLAEMLGNFEDQTDGVVLDLKSVENRGKL
jgi:hypothetical protein